MSEKHDLESNNMEIFTIKYINFILQGYLFTLYLIIKVELGANYEHSG